MRPNSKGQLNGKVLRCHICDSTKYFMKNCEHEEEQDEVNMNVQITLLVQSQRTSGSIKSIETTNSLFLWVPFLILFFHVFVKHKRDSRLKYVLVALVFHSQIFIYPLIIGFSFFKFSLVH